MKTSAWIVPSIFTIGLLLFEARCATLVVPSNEFPDLKSAVAAASLGDVINVAPGTYYGSENCDLVLVDKKLSLVGGDGGKTSDLAVVDCAHTSRCLTVSGTSSNVSISGFQFLNGQSPNTNFLAASSPTSARFSSARSHNLNAGAPHLGSARSLATASDLQQESLGGCILVTSGAALAISNSVVENGRSSRGGGLAVMQADVRLVSVTFRGCGVRTSGETLLEGGGALFVESSVALVRCSFISNFIELVGDSTGEKLTGGGAAGENCVDMRVQECWFERNSIVMRGSNSMGEVDANGDLVQGTLMGAGMGCNICVGFTMSNTTFLSNLVHTEFSVLTSTESESQSLTSNIYGGGFCLYQCHHAIISSPFFEANGISSNGSRKAGSLIGAGAYLYVDTITVTTSIIKYNYIDIVGPSTMRWVYGGGISFEDASLVRFTNSSIHSNWLHVSGFSDTSFYGAGVYRAGPENTTWMSNLEVFNNSIVLEGDCRGVVNGAGMYFENTFPIVADYIIIRNNWIRSRSKKGGLIAAGIYLYRCADSLLRWSQIVNNTVVGVYGGLIESVPYVAPSVNTTQGVCSFYTRVYETIGTLDDGSGGEQYTNDQDCIWYLSPSDSMDRVYGTYIFSFEMLDVEYSPACTWDYVGIYDGSSLAAPLIGKYCGSLTSKWACTGGPCPPLDNIPSTGGDVAIGFHTDSSETGDGFKLSWRMQIAGSRSGKDGVIADYSDSSSVSMGGGVAVFEGSLVMENVLIRLNSVLHPLQALGGGVLVANGAYVQIINSVIASNEAVSAVAGGGGIGAVRGGVVEIRWSEVSQNRATCRGECFWAPDGQLRCPSSWGGASVSIGSSVLFERSTLVQNVVTCESAKSCKVRGGAIAVAGQSIGTMVGGRCAENLCACKKEAGCEWGAGGCIVGDSGLTNVSGWSIIEANEVIGTGGGGGVFMMGVAVMRLGPNVTVLNNTAKEGAGVWVSESAAAWITGCVIEDNRATSIAGGLAASGDVALSVSSTIIRNNFASRASALLGYNDNGKAKYTFTNVAVTGPVGSMAIMLGTVSFGDGSWDCTHAGSVFIRDSTPEYFSLTCQACGQGSYSVSAASSTIGYEQKCEACSYGSSCEGANSSWSGLVALPAFWGSLGPNGTVTFYNCPPGYCCASGDVACAYNHCQGRREGRLCGSCPSGHGLRFFSEACVANESCKDTSGVAFVGLIVMASCLALWLVVTTGNEASGRLSVLLFFYQSSPLVKSTPWKYAAATSLAILQSAFNMSPTSGERSGNSGICLWEGMTAGRKMAAKIMYQGLVMLCLAGLFAVHWCLHHPMLKISWFASRPPVKSHYFICFVRFVTIAYTPLVLVPLQLVQCVWIDSEQVWWWDAKEHCYQGWQIAGFCIAVLLIPVPLMMLVVMARWKTEEGLTKWQRGVRQVLSNGYREERRWWMSVSLYRRLLLVFAFAGVTDANWRAAAVMTLCSLYLGMHVLMKPFANVETQRAETLSLVGLCLLAASSAPQLSQLQFGSQRAIVNEENLEWLQWTLIILPALVFVFLSLKATIQPLIQRADLIAKERSSDETRKDFYVCAMCVAESGIDMKFGSGEWSLEGCPIHQIC